MFYFVTGTFSGLIKQDSACSKFLLKELKEMDMLYQTTKDHESCVRQFANLRENEIKPIAFALDQNNEFPDEIVKKIGENNWMGLPYSKKDGGAFVQNGHPRHSRPCRQSKPSGSGGTAIAENCSLNLLEIRIAEMGMPETPVLQPQCAASSFFSMGKYCCSQSGESPLIEP